MVTVTLDEARERLGELVDRAAGGDRVCITVHGEPVAEISASTKLKPGPREPIDFARLRALTASMTPQTESAGDFIRRMRDEDRY